MKADGRANEQHKTMGLEINQLDKHLQRLQTVFQELELITDNKNILQVYELAKAYYNDALFFRQKKELLKALELESYCWGLLDALAIMKALKVPKPLQEWFKTEFND